MWMLTRFFCIYCESGLEHHLTFLSLALVWLVQDGRAALHIAAEENNPTSLVWLIKTCGVDVNSAQKVCGSLRVFTIAKFTGLQLVNQRMARQHFILVRKKATSSSCSGL